MKPSKIKGKFHGTYHINYGCPWFIQINHGVLLIEVRIYKNWCGNQTRLEVIESNSHSVVQWYGASFLIKAYNGCASEEKPFTNLL